MKPSQSGAEFSIQECIAREAIREKQALYCRAVDRCDEQLLRSVYWPDATDNHGYFSGSIDEFIDWVMPQLVQMECTHHQIGLPSILIEGLIAKVETYWTGYKRMKPGPDARDHVSGGRYLDIMEQRGKEWRILRRLVVFDWSTTTENYPWVGSGYPKPATIDQRTIGQRAPNDKVYSL
jgi:hypothetical protein